MLTVNSIILLSSTVEKCH